MADKMWKQILALKVHSKISVTYIEHFSVTEILNAFSSKFNWEIERERETGRESWTRNWKPHFTSQLCTWPRNVTRKCNCLGQKNECNISGNKKNSLAATKKNLKIKKFLQGRLLVKNLINCSRKPKKRLKNWNLDLENLIWNCFTICSKNVS